jgi:hypothetical protein
MNAGRRGAESNGDKTSQLSRNRHVMRLAAFPNAEN